MNIVDFNHDVCALTDTGLVRPHNEDSNGTKRTRNGDLFVVCDGMGGHAGGQVASQIAVDSVCQYVSRQDCRTPQHLLIEALEFANKQILSEARANPQLRGMGTTACVVLVQEDKVWYAHVGDSRIYYFNHRRPGLYRLTKDHSVVQALVDQGIITEAEAEHHPDKNKIRKCLGIREDAAPESCELPLQPADGDMMLICSDGLSGMVSEADILEVLCTKAGVKEAARVLVEMAKTGGGTDNITVQLLRFRDTGNKEAFFVPKSAGIFRSPMQNESHSVRWPMLVIGVSVLFIILAALLYLTEGKDVEPEAAPVVELTEEPVGEPAYAKYIKGLIGKEIEPGHLFYKNVNIEGEIVDLYVNEYLDEWQSGEFSFPNGEQNPPRLKKGETRDRYGNLLDKRKL